MSRELRGLEMAAPFDSQRLLSLVPIMPHHWVADVGCGVGKHTVPLGKYLFSGKVFALDVDQEKLDGTQYLITMRK